MKKIFLLLAMGFMLYSCGPQENPDPGIVFGSFTDSRDGKVYKTVTIGEQLWMAENLAYLPSVVGPATESYTDPYYYVYGYDGTSVATAKATNNYQTYGVLYNWPAAMASCPQGWHLPSDAEWTQLETYLANNGHNYYGSVGGDNFRGKIAISLASATGWAYSDIPGAIGNTNTAYDAYRNKSGFTALPGGSRFPFFTFLGVGSGGNWWSSAQGYEIYACSRSLDYNNSGVNSSNYGKDYGFSVRCLRD